MKKWLETVEERLATWWRTSRLRLPLSFIHHIADDVLDNGYRTMDAMETWKATLATRKYRLTKREQKRHAVEEQGNKAVQW